MNAWTSVLDPSGVSDCTVGLMCLCVCKIALKVEDEF